VAQTAAPVDAAVGGVIINRISRRRAEGQAVQSVTYIIAVSSIGTFLFWLVHRYERDHRAAIVLKLTVVDVGVAAVLRALLSLMH
jgi:hypothetical protein